MRTLSEYVSWLNSMTTSELIKEFPGQFHILKGSESSDESVKKILANDAILWKMVKEYNQKLISTEHVNSKNEFNIANVSVSLPKSTVFHSDCIGCELYNIYIKVAKLPF